MKITTVLPLLVFSFSPVAKGVVFMSAGSGNWEVPGSWVPGGVPNPFLFDSAMIGPGHAISYNGSGTAPFPGGNLVVANGNLISITGGSLNQTWVPGAPPPFGTAIAIGVTGPGTGPGSGAGTMSLNSGGLFDSGTANAVAVGITASAIGASTGDGTVFVNDGTFLMGLGAGTGSPGAQGLGIGIDAGAIGTVNIGDSAGSAGTAILDLASNNALLTVGGRLSTAAGGTGTLSIASDGVLIGGTAAINVGDDGGTGHLIAGAGSASTSAGEVNVGTGGASIGTATINGGTHALGVTSVGRSGGMGTLTANGGNTTVNGNLIVGRDGGSNGRMDINAGATVTSSEFRAGLDGGTGEVNILGGTYVQNGWAELGTGVGSSGTLNIIGPTAEYVHTQFADDMPVGYNGGTGEINISNGGKMTTNWWLNIARAAGSMGRVNIDGAGSALYMDPTSFEADPNAQTGGPRLNIGEHHIGSMNLTNGGVVQIGAPFGYGGREAYVGREAGSDGLLTVRSGAEFQANGNWALIVGNVGKGQVDVDTGGKILSNNWIAMASEPGSEGTVNIGDGALVEAGSPTHPTTHEGRFVVGRLGRALVNQSGGVVRVDNWLAIAVDAGGEGTYNFNGGRIELAHVNYGDRNIIVGNNGNGTMNITHGTPAGDTIVSGVVDGTFGDDINVFNVAAESNGVGRLDVNLADPAGVIVHRELYAGWAAGGSTGVSNGTINILRGTLRTDGWVEIGRGQINSGGTGTVNVDGPNARWERGTLVAPGFDPDATGLGPRDVNIGQGDNPNFGKGYLNVRNGGTVNHNWWINLARQPGSEGHITLDGAGSTINIVDSHLVGLGKDGNAQLNVGEGGTGTLEITDGGVFNHSMDNGGGEVWIARNDGATGTMTVAGAGAEFNSKGREFRIGANNLGTGTLNILDGGVVNFICTRENGVPADGNFGLAEHNDSLGMINMNNGTLNVSAWSLFSAWNQPATEAQITMTNSTINIINHNPIDGGGNPTTGGHLFWGDAGTATINQDGGLIAAQGWSAIGHERGGDAFYNMTNGAAMTVGGGGGNELYVGRQSHGTITMGAGTSITVAGLMSLAQETSPTTPASGTVNNNGGTLSVGDEFNVGRNGPPENVGIYNQAAGSLMVGGNAFVGRDSTQGTLLITGGTAQVNNSLFIGGSGVGLARIETMATVLGGVTVGANGTLAGSGTVNSGAGISVESGGTVSPGMSPGTLTLQPSVTFDAGSNYVVEIQGPGIHDRIVSGTVTANGTVTVILDGYAPGNGDSFDIVDAAISGTPNFDFSGAGLSLGLVWDDTQFLVDGTIRVQWDPSDPYYAWADSFGLVGGRFDDDDNDGSSNFLEFATNSNPTQGGAGPRYFGKVVNLGGDDIMTFTVAVRSGAVFAPDGVTQEATQDKVIYTVEASDDLVAWDVVPVTELNPADSATVQGELTLPVLDAGWEWHSFRTDGTVLLDPQDAVRLSVASAP